MAKAPGFMWYPKDCDTDENVRLMDDREFGFYMRCLNHSWLNEGLPGAIEDIARSIGRPHKYVERLWVRVGRCFELRDGRNINPRQEDQRESVRQYVESRKKGAEARWKHKHDLSTCISINDAHAMHVEDMRIGNGISSNTSSQDKTETPDFSISDWAEERYSKHPKKGRKIAALNYLSEKPGLHDPAWRDQFTRKHEAWIASERWRWKSGAAAPYFDEFIRDETYLYDPPADEQEDEALKILRERRATSGK